MNIVVALATLQLSNHISPCTATGANLSFGNTNYIKTSCNVTMYPRLCYNVLKIYADTVETSPKVLAHTALDVALKFTKQTHFTVTRYTEIKALNPTVTAAMHDCVEELSGAVEKLQKSKVELGLVVDGSVSGLHVSNVQTWLSAALTNENTCKEGFADLNLNGKVEKITGRKIVKVARLTSNALALINLYASAKVALP